MKIKNKFSWALVFALNFGVLTLTTAAQTHLPPQHANAATSRVSLAQSKSKTDVGNIKASLKEAIDVIKRSHVGGKDLNYSHLFRSLINEMLGELDPYSKYWDLKDVQKLRSGSQPGDAGIGATIGERRVAGKTGVFILAPSPSRAGNDLRFGDKIVAVENWDARGRTFAEVLGKLRESANSKIKLTIERAANDERQTIEITRTAAMQTSVRDAYLLQTGVGYIDLRAGLNTNAVDELEGSLNTLQSKGATSLVLDLRDNPGGLLNQAVQVSQHFLPAGKAIVTQKGKSSGERRFVSENRNPNKLPLVVLVNKQTASGSEIVVGALQHHGRAVIVGEPTFGQNLVQSFIPLEYGSALTLTSSRSLRAAAIAKGVESTISLTPDEMVEARQKTATQQLMIDPIFGFARLLVNGRLNGFQSYKVSGPIDFTREVKRDEIQISNDLFEAFKAFVTSEHAYRLTDKQLDADRRFISRQLRHEIATATFGSVVADRILLDDDAQLLKAIEVLPKAAALAGAYRDD